jgi:hypothetical protein
MPHIKLSEFSGIAPRVGPALLEGNQAQIAKNVKLQSGELRAWKKETLVRPCSVLNTKTIYKFNGPTGVTPVWLEWASDVDVVPGPVADTSEFRLYFTSSAFAPRKTNWLLATGNMLGVPPFPNNYYEMGVPAPTLAPTLSASGGAEPLETRAYVYTHVTEFGVVAEESAPSPAGTVTCATSGATVVLTAFSTPPTGNYNFKYRRIYRTVTGAASVTYQFVAEIPIAQTSYSDTKTVAQLGSVLSSIFYTPPPAGLRGLIAMPNGILAGFVGNQVWFCEPYLPHAWPANYMLTVKDPIVGLGTFGNTLFVGTSSNPYLITGSTPGSMTQEMLPLVQPCASKRSIASDQYGVLYASPNGLVSLGLGTQDVVTTPLYTRDEWQLVNPETMIGMIYNNQYFGFHTDDAGTRAIVLTRGDIPPLIEFEFDAVAVHTDKTTGQIFGVSAANNSIYEIDSSEINQTTYEWQSKKFVLPNPMNFGAFKVQADFTAFTDTAEYNAKIAAIQAQNQAIWDSADGNLDSTFAQVLMNERVLNGSALQDIPEFSNTRSINVFIYADGELFFQTAVTTEDPIRLPAMKKCATWEIKLTGNVPVRGFVMASSIAELRQLIPA